MLDDSRFISLSCFHRYFDENVRDDYASGQLDAQVDLCHLIQGQVTDCGCRWRARCRPFESYLSVLRSRCIFVLFHPEQSVQSLGHALLGDFANNIFVCKVCQEELSGHERVLNCPQQFTLFQDCAQLDACFE